MEKEILSVRIDKITFEILTMVKNEFNISFSDFMRIAIFYYIKLLKTSENVRKELKDYIKFYEMKTKADFLREKSKMTIKQYTLLYHQKRILNKLQKQGLKDFQLTKLKKAFKEEAKAYKISEDIFNKRLRKKPLVIVKGKR